MHGHAMHTYSGGHVRYRSLHHLLIRCQRQREAAQAVPPWRVRPAPGPTQDGTAAAHRLALQFALLGVVRGTLRRHGWGRPPAPPSAYLPT